MKEVTYVKSWEMLDTGVRLGTLPSFAYVLGCHVLHFMHKNSCRVASISLPTMYGVALHFPGNGRYLAGQLDTLVHEGIGTQIVPAKYHISAHYIDALQKLHWCGVLRSCIDFADTSKEGWDETHFTMDPRLCEGSKWNEDTPVHYLMSNLTLQEAVEKFAAAMDTTLCATPATVGFL